MRSKTVMESHKQRHRAIANARERDRTESVNNAFNILRQLLPTEPKNRKLSKIEILRLATSYIEHLNNVRGAIFNGEADDNICAKIKNDVKGIKSKTKVCTFCITSSKIKSSFETKSQSQSIIYYKIVENEIQSLPNVAQNQVSTNLETAPNISDSIDEFSYKEMDLQSTLPINFIEDIPIECGHGSDELCWLCTDSADNNSLFNWNLFE